MSDGAGPEDSDARPGVGVGPHAPEASGTRPGLQRPAGRVTVPEVHLALPATPEFVRLARVTATGLASRAGFSIDEVEDLRLAIDELCFTLIGTKGREGRLELRYRLDGTELEVHGSLAADDVDVPHLSDWSDQILDALVDEHEVGRNVAQDGTAACGFRMVKRAS